MDTDAQSSRKAKPLHHIFVFWSRGDFSHNVKRSKKKMKTLAVPLFLVIFQFPSCLVPLQNITFLLIMANAKRDWFNQSQLICPIGLVCLVFFLVIPIFIPPRSWSLFRPLEFHWIASDIDTTEITQALHLLPLHQQDRSPLFSPSSCRSTTPAFHHNQELLAVFQIPSILIFQTLAIPFFSPSVPPIYVSFFVLCRSALLDRNLKKKEVKKRGGGFAKLCKLSPELEKFTGVLELARIEVVKQLWCYIREKNFQDPSNRRNIICDNTLRNLFGVDSIDMFQMNKALTKHIWKIDASGAAVISAPKDKPRKQERNKVGSSCTMRRGVFLNGQGNLK
ncbi:uncharacterized protein [Henckelia pumila]|uniref:uncharacterized protein isoform X1 n=1 Tax=Henckelia pumila TaxID=405737 RepID=UPI003C6E6644